MIILFLTIIILMRILQSLFSKKASLEIPNGTVPYIKYIGYSQLFAALFAFVLIFVERDFSGIDSQMVVIATCSGLALASSLLFSIKALSTGTIVLNSLFGTAGLIVPCILGIFIFDEPVSLTQVLCIIALFVSAVMLTDSSKKISDGFSKKTVFYLIGSLLSNGVVMFCQKLFGELQPDGNVSLFSMFTFLIPAALMFLAIPFVSEKTETPKNLPKKLIGYILILAFAVFVIQQLITILTPMLSSAVLFTFSGGGATVVAALVGAFVYNEKITPKSACGIILGIAAMLGIKFL